MDIIETNIIDHKELLNRLQQTELEILLEVHKICKKYSIPYQLFGGTLIGAIRHKGFIPWDDDIDICMKRDDYEKFISIFKKEVQNKYFLQNYETDPEFFHSFTRIRKNNTIALQKQYENHHVHHGIFIDIFPFDNVPNNKIIRLFHYKSLSFVRLLKELKLSKYSEFRKISIRNIVKTVFKISINGIPFRVLNKVETKLAKLYKTRETDFATLLVETIKTNYCRCMRSNSKIKDLIEIEFENNLFLGPKNYDDVLRKMYGDYMILPPEDERKAHHNLIKLEFQCE
ncbi:MAG TPA: hypothetical protein DER56_04695 [Thermosipho africanus]|nr:hypothetical protein [Thermosipho africanus]